MALTKGAPVPTYNKLAPRMGNCSNFCRIVAGSLSSISGQFAAKSLPGLVSQSVLLWDRVCLEWTRMAKGRLTVGLIAAA
jgi:hypothetical protein